MIATTERPISTAHRFDRRDLVARLLEMPGEIAEAEDALLAAACHLQNAKDDLQAAEDAALLEVDADGAPVINGKNESIRAAQLRQRTVEQRNDVAAMQEVMDRARGALSLLVNEFSALKHAARLLAGGCE